MSLTLLTTKRAPYVPLWILFFRTCRVIFEMKNLRKAHLVYSDLFSLTQYSLIRSSLNKTVLKSSSGGSCCCGYRRIASLSPEVISQPFSLHLNPFRAPVPDLLIRATLATLYLPPPNSACHYPRPREHLLSDQARPRTLKWGPCRPDRLQLG